MFNYLKQFLKTKLILRRPVKHRTKFVRIHGANKGNRKHFNSERKQTDRQTDRQSSFSRAWPLFLLAYFDANFVHAFDPRKTMTKQAFYRLIIRLVVFHRFRFLLKTLISIFLALLTKTNQTFFINHIAHTNGKISGSIAKNITSTTNKKSYQSN